jgi:hypothetical protein
VSIAALQYGAPAKSALVIEVERQMLELVAKGASLSEVLDTLTRAIEQLSPESHCTIMLLDEEHRRYLSIASGPSLPPVYLQALGRLEIGPEVGACGSAAFRNEAIVIDDIATDYRFASARDFVLSHGLRSVWSQPIRDSRNTVLGTFAIYRRKVATPATISFAIAPCSLGFVIIAVSEQVIRSIMVGDDPEMLVSDLQNQFPNDAIEVTENDNDGLVAKVVDLIERPDQVLDLPLDIRGTDFQMQVWDALQKVPVGGTVNYTFLAEHIGLVNPVA